MSNYGIIVYLGSKILVVFFCIYSRGKVLYKYDVGIKLGEHEIKPDIVK